MEHKQIAELKTGTVDEQYEAYLSAKKYLDLLTRNDQQKEIALRQAILDYENTHAVR